MIKLKISWESWSRTLFSLVKPLPLYPKQLSQVSVFFFIFKKRLELFGVKDAKWINYFEPGT